MRDEWREEAGEMYEKSTIPNFVDNYLDPDLILDLMVEFAIKKQSERGM